MQFPFILVRPPQSGSPIPLCTTPLCLPLHNSSSHFSLPQASSKATVYHDPLGTTTSTLAADLQTSGSGGGGPGSGMDALCTLRMDVRRKGVLGRGGRATLGLAASRLAGEQGQRERGRGSIDYQ